MKCILSVVMMLLAFSFESQAQYYPRPLPRPYPVPYRPLPPPIVPYYPAPIVVPQPYVITCYAQGTYNGLIFYGLGYDTYTANNRALVACQLSGQACILTGCR